MASVTKTSNETSMADEEPRDDATPAKSGSDKGAPLSYAPAKPGDKGPGFFTIYKKGQGYWTRMGTVAGVVLIGGFTAYNLYDQMPTFLPGPPTMARPTALKIAAAIAVAFVAIYSLIVWRVLNKPSNVDFLVATDSEMKKVNWTSRTELIGSTKIVVIFMFLIALFLFGVDQIFGWAMYFIHVLKVSPLG